MIPDAHRGLLRALRRRLGGTAGVEGLGHERWASATFTGARHRVALHLDAASAEALVTTLGDVELPLPGHIVADIVPLSQEHAGDVVTLTIEALTVEAA